MGFLKGKAPAFIALIGVLVIFICIFAVSALFTETFYYYRAPSGMIEGEYSVDGGPWMKTDLKQPIDDHFRNIVFKGKQKGVGVYFSELSISMKNVWFTLKTADGTLIYDNNYRIEGN